jgi:hypothetical protein
MRRKWPFLIVVVAGALVFGAVARRADAQQTTEPSSTTALQTVGANDMQSSTQVAWLSGWAFGRFGTLSVFNWGRTPVRSGSGRAIGAVLRERRGLLR